MLRFIIVLCCLVPLSGCDNPVLSPDTSSAISHQIERKEYKEQTKALNRIADILEERLK